MRPPRRGSGDRGQGGEEPAPIRVSLSRLASSYGIGDVEALVVVFERWEAVVGERIAAHASPAALEGTVLSVEVDQPQWATQIRLMAAGMIDKLNQSAGRRIVSELRVVPRRQGNRSAH